MVTVCGRRESATILRDRLHTTTQSAASPDFDPAWVEIDVLATDDSLVDEPNREVAARCHLVIGHGLVLPWVDLTVSTVDEIDDVVADRLIPWVSKWRVGRRAPRLQVARLLASDSSWPATAERLKARLEWATADQPVLRIDHIGSTSVPGIKAKDLVDLQVTVPTFVDAAPVAEAAVAAGFVHVAADLFGKDRRGEIHPEEVCVDADPGRPVNVNIRSVDAPVARDAVLFRDWLRANEDARLRYEAFKELRAGRHIDEYGDAKEPFISACLVEAEEWAAATSWAGFET